MRFFFFPRRIGNNTKHGPLVLQFHNFLGGHTQTQSLPSSCTHTHIYIVDTCTPSGQSKAKDNNNNMGVHKALFLLDKVLLVSLLLILFSLTSLSRSLKSNDPPLPPGFLFGTASSSYQVTFFFFF